MVGLGISLLVFGIGLFLAAIILLVLDRTPGFARASWGLAGAICLAWGFLLTVLGILMINGVI